MSGPALDPSIAPLPFAPLPVDSDCARLLQIARVALSCARMCAWDWDIQKNHTIYFGDPDAIFGCEPEGDYLTGFRSKVHPDDIEAVETTIQALCLSKTVEYEDEFRVMHAEARHDGSTLAAGSPTTQPVPRSTSSASM